MSSIEKRSFSLRREHTAFIDKLVFSGAYATGSEVIRAGLRALQERDAAVGRWLGNGAAPVLDIFKPATKLDAATERATSAFIHRLDGRYTVSHAILFGSRALQTHSDESDADLAIILEGAHGDRSVIVKDMAGIAFHVMMETGIMVEALPLWSDEISRPEIFSNPALIHNILRDGVYL